MTVREGIEDVGALRSLRRRWAAAVLATVAGLGLGYGVWSDTGGREQAIAWLAWAGAASAYVLWVFWRALPEHRRRADGRLLDHLGPGNVATVARGAGAAWLFGLLGTTLPSADLGWTPSLLCLVIAVLDHVDGRLARAGGETTGLGEKLDLDYDAFSNLAAYALAVHLGRIPAVLLLLGLLRYLFAFGLWRLRRSGRTPRPLAPSTGRRVIASLQWGFLVGVLWPIVSPPATTIAAGLMAAALVASFGRDWLVVGGRLDPDSVAYRRMMAAARKVFLTVIPMVIRLALAAVLAGAIVSLAASLRAGESRLGDTGPSLTVLAAVAGVAIPALVLGAAARTAAVVLLVADVLTIHAIGFDLLQGAVLSGCVGLILLGSGAGSLWTPEVLLFRPDGET
ncbi:MAG TPA: CDP-alcohol phosphatidyltransferase family protein [Anaerolineales bacterium]